MNIQSILYTAGDYITLFTNVDTRVLLRSEADKLDFGTPFGGRKAVQTARHLMRDAPDRSIYCIEGDLSVCLCLAFLEEYTLLAGPFREKEVTKTDLRKTLHLTRETFEEAMALYRQIPMAEEERILLALRMPFATVYNSVLEASTARIISREHDSTWFDNELPFIVDYDSEKQANERTMNTHALFSALCMGNHVAALKMYESVLSSKKRVIQIIEQGDRYLSEEDRIHVVEGLTTIRVLTSLALSTARVPAAESYALLRNYKLQVRLLHSFEDTGRITRTMLIKACQLVREQISTQYSAPMRNAISYIHGNLAEPMTVADVAQAAGMTPTSLTRKFHAEVGISPVAYIRRERMRMASELLLYTNCEISEICGRIGMTDANYFTKCFKSEFGCTPTEYRRQVANNDN